MKGIYVIPRLNEIEKFNKLEKEYNLHYEFNEFFIPSLLDNKEELEKVISKYQGRSGDTLHGAFFDTALDSSDSKIRKISFERFVSSLEIASRLNCKAVIFHTNYLNGIKTEKYKKNWVESYKNAYKELLKMFPNIDIYVENMFDDDFKLILELAKEMKDEKRFGICLDIAHANLSKESIYSWIDNCKPYIKHFHINDNFKDMDSHLAIGDGSIPYKEVFLKIKDIDASILIEVKNYDDTLKSLNIIKRWL